MGGGEDELAGGVGVAADDSSAEEFCVAFGGELQVEFEVFDGVGKGLEGVVALDDAEAGGGLRGDFELDSGPSLALRRDVSAGKAVGALILKGEASVFCGEDGSCLAQLCPLGVDEEFDVEGVGSALAACG